VNPEVNELSTVLDRRCVGPAPWYWKTFPGFGEHHEWRFVPAGPIGYPNGNPALFELQPGGVEGGAVHPVLVVRTYTRVLRSNESHVLLWGPRRREGDLLIESFALGELQPVAEGAVGEREPLWTAAVPATDHLTIPQTLPAGRAPGRYIAQAASMDLEVLLLADAPDPREAATSIYVWHPAIGTVDVIPLTWFREDKNDLGYEWITRVMRDPETGNFFGDGIRMAPFELDGDGRLLRTTA
jgi:hypothetical protein